MSAFCSIELLTAYAATKATTASYTTLFDAASPGEGSKPARSTIDAYRSALTDLYLLDPLPGYLPTRKPLRRVSLAPKRQLADPALAARR
jgi:hypothetical protein